MKVLSSGLWVLLERKFSPAGFCITGVVGHSLTALLFPWGRGHHHLTVQHCAGLPWVRAALLKLFLPTSLHQWHARIPLQEVRKAGLLKCLSCLWISAQVSTLQAFSQLWQKVLGQVCFSSGSTVHAKVCLPLAGYTDGWDSSYVPWHMVLDATAPTKALLFMNKCLTFYWKGGTKKRNHDADITSVITFNLPTRLYLTLLKLSPIHFCFSYVSNVLLTETNK